MHSEPKLFNLSGYLYYSAKDACYAAYRQGPCKKGEHFVLKTNSLASLCVENPCKEGFAR